MPLQQILSNDSFATWINKTNSAIAYISNLSPSSLEIISINSPTDGHILRYNNSSTFFENVGIYGTTNRIIISSGATGITISAPQDLHSGASPSFASITLSNPLGIDMGGTGASGASGALNNLLPSQSGNSGKFLSTNGSNVSWETTIIEPGGMDTEVQFKDDTSFAGASGLKYNKSTHVVTASTRMNSPIFGSTGPIAFRPGIDAADVFDFQSATGASSVFTVNTLNGRVGINKKAPAYPLDVLGDINLTTGSAVRINGSIVLNSSGQLTTASQPNITSLGTLASLTVSGNTSLATVTSGTWNGTAISGQYGGTGTNNSGKTITLGGNLATSGAHNLTLTLTAATNVTLPTSGTLFGTASTTFNASSADLQLKSLGVGTAASGTTGDVRATGDVTAYYSSDSRLKNNIQNIGNALEKLLMINGVSFEWNDEYIDLHGGEDPYFLRRKDVGVIAQEIEKILPEAVAKRSDGFLAVRYEKLIPLIIEAIKELSIKSNE